MASKGEPGAPAMKQGEEETEPFSHTLSHRPSVLLFALNSPSAHTTAAFRPQSPSPQALPFFDCFATLTSPRAWPFSRPDRICRFPSPRRARGGCRLAGLGGAGGGQDVLLVHLRPQQEPALLRRLGASPRRRPWLALPSPVASTSASLTGHAASSPRASPSSSPSTKAPSSSPRSLSRQRQRRPPCACASSPRTRPFAT